MKEATALLAALYVVGYLLAQTQRRRAHGRLVVLCPLRSAAVPEEIVERLGSPAPITDVGPFLDAELMISHAFDPAALVSPGRRPIFAPEPSLRPLAKWTAATLYDLALEALHVRRPRSLLVDFRPPSDPAAGRPYSLPESDVDLGMFGYELRCRLRRYSRYADASFTLLFCGKEAAWRITG